MNRFDCDKLITIVVAIIIYSKSLDSNGKSSDWKRVQCTIMGVNDDNE